MLVLVVSSSTMSPSHMEPVSYNPVSPSFAFHPRLSELHPDNFHGEEGLKVFGFDLKKSVILVTPGLVQPSPHVTNHPALPVDVPVSDFCNFKKFSENHRSEKVRSYLEMLYLKENTRHRGEKKSGFKVLQPVAKGGEACHTDGLTAGGVTQMIQLGEFLARSYAGKLGTLNSATSQQGLAETVGDLVLYQSIVAVLHGLLTDKQFVSAEVNKLSSDFASSVKDKVLSYKSELHYYADKAYKTEGQLFKDFKTSDLERELPARDILTYLSNIIHSYTHTDFKVVNLLENMELTVWDIDRLFNKSDTHHRYLASSPYFQMYANHHTYHLRQRIKEFLHFKDSSEGDDLKLLAVDDLMMLSLLVSLNLTVNRHLPPASRLTMELFHLSSVSYSGHNGQNLASSHYSKVKDSHVNYKISTPFSNKHPSLLSTLYPTFQHVSSSSHKMETQNPIGYVRVLFNGHVITPSLPACSADALANLGLCNSEYFQHLLVSFLETSQPKVEL